MIVGQSDELCYDATSLELPLHKQGAGVLIAPLHEQKLMFRPSYSPQGRTKQQDFARQAPW